MRIGDRAAKKDDGFSRHDLQLHQQLMTTAPEVGFLPGLLSSNYPSPSRKSKKKLRKTRPDAPLTNLELFRPDRPKFPVTRPTAASTQPSSSNQSLPQGNRSPPPRPERNGVDTAVSPIPVAMLRPAEFNALLNNAPSQSIQRPQPGQPPYQSVPAKYAPLPARRPPILRQNAQAPPIQALRQDARSAGSPYPPYGYSYETDQERLVNPHQRSQSATATIPKSPPTLTSPTADGLTRSPSAPHVSTYIRNDYIQGPERNQGGSNYPPRSRLGEERRPEPPATNNPTIQRDHYTRSPVIPQYPARPRLGEEPRAKPPVFNIPTVQPDAYTRSPANPQVPPSYNISRQPSPMEQLPPSPSPRGGGISSTDAENIGGTMFQSRVEDSSESESYASSDTDYDSDSVYDDASPRDDDTYSLITSPPLPRPPPSPTAPPPPPPPKSRSERPSNNRTLRAPISSTPSMLLIDEIIGDYSSRRDTLPVPPLPPLPPAIPAKEPPPLPPPNPPSKERPAVMRRDDSATSLSSRKRNDDRPRDDYGFGFGSGGPPRRVDSLGHNGKHVESVRRPGRAWI